MKISMAACLVAGLMLVTPAMAVSIDAQVEGPLLRKDSVIESVRQNLKGPIAELPDLEQGGKYRLFVRVASKHTGPGSWFLYLAEIQLQRRVADAETQRLYWASIRSAVLWGTVPTENEIRDALSTLLSEKVNFWNPD